MPAVTRRTATALRGSKASPVLAFFMRGWHSAACVRPQARWCALGLLAGCATVPGSPEAVPGLSGSGFTPRVVNDILQTPGEAGGTIALVDIDTSRLTSLFDRAIVASGDSNRQTRALARHVADKAREAGLDVIGIEGEGTGEWVLVDLGAIVVHIMQPATRSYYNLEELWGAVPARPSRPGAIATHAA